MPRTTLHTPTTQHAIFNEEKQTVPTRLFLSTCKSWESSVYEVLLSAAPPDNFLRIPIEGGSDSGKFCVVGPEVNPSRLVYHPILSGPKKTASILRPGDVILEIGDYQVSELTNRPREVTRDNIYQRVVPCTTRAPRPDEVNGVHYQFMGVKQFLALEKAGRLLESGTYKGNYYGTPQPDPTSSALDPELLKRMPESQNGSTSTNAPATVKTVNGDKSPCLPNHQPTSSSTASADDGPLLPPGWEVINHPEYGTFYIDHVHRKTQYEPPTAADFEEAASLLTAHLVVPCEHPSSSMASSSRQSSILQNMDSSPVTVLRTPSINSARSSSSSSSLQCRYRPDLFTSDISKLRGPLVTATLTKGPRGFGFTIIGGSSPTQPGFLQIKNIISGGPAALNGVLAIGDVLVSVNGVNVLGFSHDEIVSLFQSIPVDSSVTLVVSQGYALCNGDLNRLLGQNQEAESLSSQLPPQNTEISIVKQQNGFGFTLADQPQGQRVKEVLDPARCDGLKVGDIVVEINDQRVKELSHPEVVKLLKTCPVGKTTRFLVQRSMLLFSTNNVFGPDDLIFGFRSPLGLLFSYWLSLCLPGSFSGNDLCYRPAPPSPPPPPPFLKGVTR
ncbi:unnamed protein product [Schistocephalus solidus]|uniref:Membrane associated guanylate kinase, WW and PDZ domain containing 2 n=1 Tax=Schistocephalus solidus TaxID=70667 RepID=A0A183SL29_SCHSO|nr:unnamed protein product [Schistocephalus solidus]